MSHLLVFCIGVFVGAAVVGFFASRSYDRGREDGIEFAGAVKRDFDAYAGEVAEAWPDDSPNRHPPRRPPRYVGNPTTIHKGSGPLL